MPIKIMDNHRVLPLPKKKIAGSFGLKASRYGEHALIQTVLLKRLLAMIADNGPPTGIWADIGCGSGVLARLVRQRRMESMTLIGMDLACESVRCFREGAEKGSHGIVGDIDALPFKPESLSGMVMASVLQWIVQPATVVAKTGETLRIGGTCAFSIFVNDSFFELFETRRSQHLAVPVQCPEAGQVKSLFSSGQFRLVRYELFRQTMYFPDARSLLKNISSTGAGATPGKRLVRGEVDRFCACYEKKFRTDKGIPLTWQAAIGIAEKRTRA
jgi:ubiquinone/menaquinone biosynthesis C-methylase UbiE